MSRLHVQFGTVGAVDDWNSSSKCIVAAQTLRTANEAKTLAKGAH